MGDDGWRVAMGDGWQVTMGDGWWMARRTRSRMGRNTDTERAVVQLCYGRSSSSTHVSNTRITPYVHVCPGEAVSRCGWVVQWNRREKRKCRGAAPPPSSPERDSSIWERKGINGKELEDEKETWPCQDLLGLLSCFMTVGRKRISVCFKYFPPLFSVFRFWLTACFCWTLAEERSPWVCFCFVQK